MSLMSLIIRYASFAMVATIVNLTLQRAVLQIVPERYGLLLAIAVGTIGGLIVKYFLDKKWIFRDPVSGLLSHGRKFGLYTVMGLFTTLIFWSTEIAFWLIWGSHFMREVGAVIGLTIGYIVKYNLDRRFVFESAGNGVTV